MFNRSLTPFGAAFTPPIEQSLIFDGAAYLSRTPGSAGNRKTWTFSTWLRRSGFGGRDTVITMGNGDYCSIAFEASGGTNGDSLRVFQFTSSSFDGHKITNRLFRDVGWFHLCVVWDANNGTAADRIRIYINGVPETSFSTNLNPSTADTSANNTVVHRIGALSLGAANYFRGAMTETDLQDGTALTDAQVLATFLDSVTFDGQGLPAPKAVTGLTYGAQGSRLQYADTAAFGDDTSGNGNDWTPTGFVAGDQTADVPGRPYALWNAIWPSTGTISDGGRTTAGLGTSTLFMPSGKFYWEITANAASVVAGVVSEGGTATTTSVASGTTSGFRFDADAGALDVTTDGVNYTSVGTGLTGGRYIRSSGGSNTINSGLTTFAYTPATGFLPLHAGNLPTPTADGRNYFAVNTRTGTGATYSVTNGPANGTDLVWTKGRSGATDHALYDILRGVQQQLESNTTTAETTEATGLTAFNSTGYTAGALAQMNTSAATYVDWMLKAGGAGVANTDGTISSTVSVAAPGHFSIVGYTGTGANATVGHGLPGAPECIIIKNRDQADAWAVYHSGVAADAETDYLVLNTTAAAVDDATYWQDTAPTSSVFSIGTAVVVNTNTEDYIAYCFRSVPGVCKVGSYTGNGSADGPLIWLGFTPRWIMLKRVDSTGDWWIYDTVRGTINPIDEKLLANSSAVEDTSGEEIDANGDGFKLRSTAAGINASGGTYIYLAMADIAGGGDLPWPLAR